MNRKRTWFFASGVSLFIFLFSCTRQPPIIHEYFWQINIVNDVRKGSIHEQLSFFISCEDPDGFEDLEILYLLQDEKELYWELTPGTWTRADINGQEFLGTNEIVMYDRSDFPEGEYRMVLRDMSGEYDERRFLIKSTGTDRSAIVFPEPVIEGSRLLIKGDSPLYSLWVYGRDGTFVQPPYEVREDGLDLNRILSRKRELSQGFSYYLYIYDSSMKKGILTGPFDYQP